MSKLYRFYVESYSSEDDDWESVGSVLLADYASRSEVEHALAALGFYCPRGADVLTWDYPTGEAFAMVHDANGAPMIRMGAALERRKTS